MSTNNTISCYFKIPFTEENTTFKISSLMYISTFCGLYCNTILRQELNINPKYNIELVEANSDKGEYGPTLIISDTETFQQRYGNLTQPIPFYARPVSAETGEFIVRERYDI